MAKCIYPITWLAGREGEAADGNHISNFCSRPETETGNL